METSQYLRRTREQILPGTASIIPITQVTHVRNKNTYIQGRSLND